MDTVHLHNRLVLQGVPVIEDDLPYVQQVLGMMENAYEPFTRIENVSKEDSILVFDPEVLLFD